MKKKPTNRQLSRRPALFYFGNCLRLVMPNGQQFYFEFGEWHESYWSLRTLELYDVEFISWI